ncbi:MAG: ATP-binding cassette domain-containing protein, partial [Pseudomonadales bacterium]|nr:ATP-binding cassette domain-containing protein [Pseudomonadales bacterium]
MPLLELKDISRIYEMASEAIKALDGVDLCVDESERIILLGPSGSGKTTLLNCISALDSPTSGAYKFNDVEVPRNKAEQMTTFR